MKILKALGKVAAFALGGAALVAAGKSGLGKDLFTGKDDAEPLNEDEFGDVVEATAEEEVPAETEEPEPETAESAEEDS